MIRQHAADTAAGGSVGSARSCLGLEKRELAGVPGFTSRLPDCLAGSSSASFEREGSELEIDVRLETLLLHVVDVVSKLFLFEEGSLSLAPASAWKKLARGGGAPRLHRGHCPSSAQRDKWGSCAELAAETSELSASPSSSEQTPLAEAGPWCGFPWAAPGCARADIDRTLQPSWLSAA